jgi:Icc protein
MSVALWPDGGFESRIVSLLGLIRHDIGKVPEMYGPLKRLAA